ncbi:MAG: hypothetical protein OEV78_02910 [Spirochaetia bacterium]|nr:hypothetical protein [Spirochaetia bacterium]
MNDIVLVMDSIIVFVHIIAGTVLVSMSSIMQLIVGPAVSLLTDSNQKKLVTEKLKKRRVPVMDGAIIIQIMTAMYLVHARWNMILSEPVMRVKALSGIIALSLAFSAHFYFRNKKNKLMTAGKTAELKTLNEKTRFIEPLVLVFGAIAYVIGIYFNHM